MEVVLTISIGCVSALLILSKAVQVPNQHNQSTSPRKTDVIDEIIAGDIDLSRQCKSDVVKRVRAEMRKDPSEKPKPSPGSEETKFEDTITTFGSMLWRQLWQTGLLALVVSWVLWVTGLMEQIVASVRTQKLI